MKKTTRYLTQAATIAAIYVVLTLIFAPISFGGVNSAIQFRISEVMTVLPVFTPSAILGLFVGCLISNLGSPFGIMDILFGSLATLIAAYSTYKLRKKQYLAPLPPAIVNGIIVGSVIYYFSYKDVPFNLTLLLINMGTVAVGELVVCYVLGLPMMKVLNRFKDKLFK